MNATQNIEPKSRTVSALLATSALLFVTATAVAAHTLPTNGLVLHLEADSGVTVDAVTGDVTGWTDQSALANDLVATGAPQVLAGTLNGQDVISFDGVDDTLERLVDVMGLPAGDADRTMYTVVKYDSVGYGGTAFGNPPNLNEVFGLIVHPSGNLMVQGWGTANDFNSGIAGTSMGWMIQSAIHEAGTMTHYQDGAQIDLQVHTYATNPTSIVVGAEIDRNPFMDMEVAAVLIYDRALTVDEQADVAKYFSIKYFGGVDVEISAPTEAETVSSGDVTVTVTGEGTGYDMVRLELDGGAPVDLAAPGGDHTFNMVAAGAHTLVATLIDAGGNPVGLADSTATVNFTAEDCFPDDFAPNCTVDTDGDGTPDSVEGPTADTDGDGNLDYLESSTADADNDGTPDQTDSNDADPCIPSSNACAPPPAPISSGGGSFGPVWLLFLGGALALRRRRQYS